MYVWESAGGLRLSDSRRTIDGTYSSFLSEGIRYGVKETFGPLKSKGQGTINCRFVRRVKVGNDYEESTSNSV